MTEPEAEVWMGRMVELSSNDKALPDPALIWWRAQLRERRAAQARAVRPTAIAQWASLAVAVIATIVLCAVNWGGVKGVLEPAHAGVWIAFACAIGLMALALPLLFSE